MTSITFKECSECGTTQVVDVDIDPEDMYVSMDIQVNGHLYVDEEHVDEIGDAVARTLGLDPEHFHIKGTTTCHNELGCADMSIAESAKTEIQATYFVR